jgi:hypothetical protein
MVLCSGQAKGHDHLHCQELHFELLELHLDPVEPTDPMVHCLLLLDHHQHHVGGGRVPSQVVPTQRNRRLMGCHFHSK